VPTPEKVSGHKEQHSKLLLLLTDYEYENCLSPCMSQQK